MVTTQSAVGEGGSLESLALRAENPVSRAMHLTYLVIMQVLLLLALIDEPDPQTRRNHPVLAPGSLLSRFDAGETFDLPPMLIAWVRWTTQLFRARMVRDLRRQFRIADAAWAARNALQKPDAPLPSGRSRPTNRAPRARPGAPHRRTHARHPSIVIEIPTIARPPPHSRRQKFDEMPTAPACPIRCDIEIDAVHADGARSVCRRFQSGSQSP